MNDSGVSNLNKELNLLSRLRLCVLVTCFLPGPALAQNAALPIGFQYADTDHDGWITREEMRSYLKPRLKGVQISLGKVFDELDVDANRKLSEQEFEPRNQVIQRMIEAEGTDPDIAPDPGKGFQPWKGPDQPIDDELTYSAIYHRTLEASKQPREIFDIANVPLSQSIGYRQPAGESNFERALRATVILGGGDADNFFIGGGVIVSSDGLMLTNYHIAESINESLTALLADGRVVKVSGFVAGNREADVALLKLDGRDFSFVPLAQSPPPMASSLNMIHHSESRFFTYDRGYVKRYPLLQKLPWLEISCPFAPGGSGCGIFNERYELVGLVCYISIGDGPAMAAEPSEEPLQPDDDISSIDEEPVYVEMSTIVVRLAVALESIKRLWKSD